MQLRIFLSPTSYHLPLPFSPSSFKFGSRCFGINTQNDYSGVFKGKMNWSLAGITSVLKQG